MLLSVGERISMTLLSMAIHERGFEAISLTGSQCGIMTTASHSNARIMDVRPFRVQDELAKGHIVIVAGYQGTSYRREVTTLGRGGSDTTAVALAAALGAEACEIYSDVDGVYDADPRVVLNASKLEELTHDEMMEMARSGAKVLNEQAVEFARRAGIALYAKSTHLADSAGTVIRPDGFDDRARAAESGKPVVAVSHVNEGIWVEASTSTETVAEEIEDLDAAVLRYDGVRCEAFLLTQDIHDVPGLQSRLAALGEDIRVSTAGLVSAVGHGIGSNLRWARIARTTLTDAGIEPLSSFTSPTRLSWIVPSADVALATNALHSALL
jgi:aspartate kinase